MLGRTRLTGAAAGLVLAAGLPVGASAAPPLELRGAITVSGTSSFVREVVVRKTVRITAADIAVASKGGRYAGVVLRKDGRGYDGVTTTVAAMAPGFCTARGCARPAWSGTYAYKLFTGFATTPGGPADNAPLTPGRYRLYLVADGKPVTVTLKLPGAGRTAITSGAPAKVTVDLPKPSQYGPATAAGNPGHLYAAGATHRTTGPGAFHFMTSWKFVYGTPKSANQEGVCVFDGAPGAGPFGPYQYPCAGNQWLNFTPFGQVATGSKAGPMGAADQYAATLEYFGVYGDRDAHSIGGFINSPLPATSAHTTILWVDFR